MGKPLIHIIPSQEAKLRESLSNSTLTSNSEGLRLKQTKKNTKNASDSSIVWKGKQPPATSRLAANGRSVKRSTTNISNGSSKASKSDESGICSFVHSNASLSSSEDQNMALPSVNSLVPESITTASIASSRKVRLAIQNYEQGIEITRKTSASSSSGLKKQTFKITSNVGIALEAPKADQSNTGDETTISSISTSRSTSFGNNFHSTQREEVGVIPRFEVLLDEIPEKERVSSTMESSKKDKAPKEERSSAQEVADLAVVNPRLVITRHNSRSDNHCKAYESTAVPSSSKFVFDIDKHVATRRKMRPRRIKKVVHSIEIVQAPKVEDDVVHVYEDAISILSDASKKKTTCTSDLDGILSPSTMKGARQRQNDIADFFRLPPAPKLDSIPTKKKKVYSIEEGELVINEIDAYEAIELRETGSVIMDQSQENKKPYRLVRMDDANVTALIEKNRSKTSSRSKMTKGFRRKSKRMKSGSESGMLSKNPIKVINGSENIGAIELLRTPTKFVSTSTFSYDEIEEDSIIKRMSPPPSPIPPVESLHIVSDNNDIEVVAPSSTKKPEATPLVSDESMDRIVSIRKLNSQDDSNNDSSAAESLPSKEPSTPPKKFEPVVEIHSKLSGGPIAMTRTNSTSTLSAASIPSKSSTMSRTDSPSRRAIINSQQESNSAGEIEENAPKNGDRLVYIASEPTTPKVVKPVFIPRIPASKRDTKKIIFPSEESSRKVKIQVQAVQKPDGNVKNIEVSSVATPTSTESEPEGKVSTLVKKYSTMVVKKPPPTISAEEEISMIDPSSAKHVVHVNVLGVAGIVVDRKKCRDVTGNIHSPSLPEQMTAVVGISEGNQEFIDDVTTFSSPLVHAPTAKAIDNADAPSVLQRHIAVWSSNQKGETPGSIIKSKILNLKSTNRNGLKRASKFLDLKVALVKSSDSSRHTAVVIGKARIEITKNMIDGSENQTLDIPVRQVFEKDSLSPSEESRVIVLRTSSKPRNDVRNLYVEEFCDMQNGNGDGLTSAYAIDPLGDSMIRVQVEVKEVDGTPEPDTIKKSSSFANRTAATEQSDETLTPSGESAKRLDSQDMYSRPLEFATEFDEDATFHTVSEKGKSMGGYETVDEVEDPGCKLFGVSTCIKSNKGLASRIDDRIESMADQYFPGTCAGRMRDDSSLVGDATHNTGATGTTQEKMLREMKSGPVPTFEELKELAKEFAMSSGEYFFPDKYGLHETALSQDEEDDDGDDEHSGVGSATRASSQYTMSVSRDKDSHDSSWKKNRDEDDNSYSTGGSDNESGDSFSLKHNGALQFGVTLNRRVMSENNKFDLSTSTNQKERLGRSFDSFTKEEASRQVDVVGENDEEESSAEEKPALVDDILEEDNKSSDINLKRENSGKPSLPSVVENIAEVLSIGGKACGYFSSEDVDPNGVTSLVWNRQTGEVEIPQTVDQTDNQSVGDLTAMTLEKNEMKEANRKLLLKKLGLPKEILAWGRTRSEITDAEEKSQSENKNSEIAKPEDYFAEYEHGVEGVLSIYGSSSGEFPKQDDIEEQTKTAEEESPEEPTSVPEKLGDCVESQVESV